jgi:hypothetical protein
LATCGQAWFGAGDGCWGEAALVEGGRVLLDVLERGLGAFRAWPDVAGFDLEWFGVGGLAEDAADVLAVSHWEVWVLAREGEGVVDEGAEAGAPCYQEGKTEKRG